MTDVSDAQATRTYPMPRACPFSAPEQYAQLREQEPISRVLLPSGRTAWLITRHDHARQLLSHPGVSVDRAHDAYPGVTAQRAAFAERPKGFLTWMDPPEHTEHRRMLMNEFTVKRLAVLRPRVQEIVDSCVDDLLKAGSPADVVEHIALAVPTLVICELLGIPYDDRELFHERTKIIVDLTTSIEERTGALQDVGRYLAGLIARKEQQETDDLLGRMIRKYQESGSYDHAHLTGLATILLTGGFETTANMIALGVVALLQHPAERAKLVADPSLASRTADEMLRYFSVSDHATSRVTTEDIEIGGVLIRAGEGVIASNLAANRDPEMFPAPDELDISRPNARQQLAFGHGIHLCVGQNLAAMELQEVYTTLFSRVPSLELAVPFEELRFKHDSNFFGVHEVPVAWS
jgi:cytochrome P450